MRSTVGRRQLIGCAVSAQGATVPAMSARDRRRRPSAHHRPAGPPTWTVDDALRQYQALLDWLPTGDGTRAAYLAYHQVFLGDWPPEYAADGDRWRLAEASARDTATALSEAPPVWCDPPMVDLVAAAADTYPPEPFLEHHLPSPNGIVIFARPLPAVWQDQHDDVARVRSAPSAGPAACPPETSRR